LNANNKLCAFMHVANDLHILNRNLGFVHWDLHKDNILFKLTQDNNLCPKYFDFDLSDLCRVPDQHGATELNNYYFIATNNYKMCTSDNLLTVTDPKVLTTDNNILYRMRAGYLFDLIRLHTTLVFDIPESDLDVFSMNVKQFILGWTHEIRTNNAMNTYFNSIAEYVIKWTNDFNHYNECVDEILESYDICFESESCQIALLCAYNLIFSDKYEHQIKQMFFEEISHQLSGANLRPENRKYITDELNVLENILHEKKYDDVEFNKLNSIYAAVLRKCNVHPSFLDYQSFIHQNVTIQVNNMNNAE
jgi:uncharacterized protein YfkK (UPF0435 family)